MGKSTEVIPEGLYCYTYDSDGALKLCPYWDKFDEHEPQNDGYCHFLEEGDWDVDGLSLLWDQCKECGENLGEDEI